MFVWKGRRGFAVRDHHVPFRFFFFFYKFKSLHLGIIGGWIRIVNFYSICRIYVLIKLVIINPIPFRLIAFWSACKANNYSIPKSSFLFIYIHINPLKLFARFLSYLSLSLSLIISFFHTYIISKYWPTI